MLEEGLCGCELPLELLLPHPVYLGKLYSHFHLYQSYTFYFLTHGLFRNVWFNFLVFVNFTVFFLPLHNFREYVTDISWKVHIYLFINIYFISKFFNTLWVHSIYYSLFALNPIFNFVTCAFTFGISAKYKFSYISSLKIFLKHFMLWTWIWKFCIKLCSTDKKSQKQNLLISKG